MSSQLHTLKSGTMIENYRIQRVLGVGGFGITYQAQDLNLDCAVALKEYFPHGLAVREENSLQVGPKSAKDSKMYDYGLQRFLDEARTLARFKNPNIVRISRYMEKNGTAYIVMDYEDGIPLSHYLLRCKKLTEIEIKNVFRPILLGLKLVHDQDYLHRDIKPPNIYLRKKGTPVLLDFGAARQALNEHGQTVTSMGTHGYAPIEQFTTQEQQGPWSDIYAVGATIYHCISGNSPMTALDRISALQNGRKDPITSAKAVGKNKYSNELLDCIDWMLSVRADERPQYINEVIATFTMTGNESKTILTETDVDWDSELIAQAERHLAKYLGPLASTLVKQSMSQSTSLDELYHLLANNIDLPSEREQFLRSVLASSSLSGKMKRSTGPHSRTFSSQETTLSKRIDDATIEKLEEQLARHIGPLAKMIVKQTVENNADLDAVIDVLCEELPTEVERTEFRKSVIV